MNLYFITFEKAFALIQARAAGPSASFKYARSADEQLVIIIIRSKLKSQLNKMAFKSRN